TRRCRRSAGAAGSVVAAASAAGRYGVLSPRAAWSPIDAPRESRRALPEAGIERASLLRLVAGVVDGEHDQGTLLGSVGDADPRQCRDSALLSRGRGGQAALQRGL